MYYSDDCDSGKTTVKSKIVIFDWDVVPSVVLFFGKPRCMGKVLFPVEVVWYY